MKPTDPLYSCYNARDCDRALFGANWCGPARFEHMVDTLIARYEAKGDGQPVEVYCEACPARFYTVKALPGVNSVGEPVKPWTATTGSGMAELAAALAKAASEGMIRIEA